MGPEPASLPPPEVPQIKDFKVLYGVGDTEDEEQEGRNLSEVPSLEDMG